MKIISGKHKNRKIITPRYNNNISGFSPTKEKVREAVFNMLINSDLLGFRLDEASIMDIFCGSGSFGLEAISCGANDVLFIDSSKIAINMVSKSLQFLREQDHGKTLCCDALRLFAKFNNRFDIIYMDPPYYFKQIDKVINIVSTFLSPKGVLIIESAKGHDFHMPAQLELVNERRYGISKLSFLSTRLDT